MRHHTPEEPTLAPSNPAAPGKAGRLLVTLATLVKEAYEEGYSDGENHRSVTWQNTAAKRWLDELLRAKEHKQP